MLLDHHYVEIAVAVGIAELTRSESDYFLWGRRCHERVRYLRDQFFVARYHLFSTYIERTSPQNAKLVQSLSLAAREGTGDS